MSAMMQSGPLPEEYASQLDWSLLAAFIRDTILAQPHQVRTEILNRPDLPLHRTAFDEDGYCEIQMSVITDDGECKAVTILRCHWSRLIACGNHGAALN